MDFIFLCMGAVCLAEAVDLFMGKDFLMFTGDTKKDGFDLKKVYEAEKWIFLADGICSLVIGLNWFPQVVEYICVGIFALTLVIHVYIFKSRRFRR